MSRSIVRTLAGLALVASLPAVGQAQNFCTINNPLPGTFNCPVTLDMSVSVPVLARLSIPDFSLGFPTPNWTTFLATPTATTTVTSTQMTIATNSVYSVALSSGGWDAPAAWTLDDVRYAVSGTACTAPLEVPNTLLDLQTLTLVGGGVPASNYQRFLCLGLVYPGNLADERLAPGTFDLPLVLTITAP